MSQLLSVKIDFTKIPKEKLFKGEKGTYGNITVSINDQPDQFGKDVSVWFEQTKEEREAKADRIFLGGGKVIYKSQTPASVPTETSVQAIDDDDDKLPF